MSEITPVASFRRVTPAIVASSRLAMTNDVPDTAKGDVAVLLKQAAPILGIDGTTYHVMDILLGLSRPEDWKGTGRPIVAVSNAKLAEYTMRSERTVIRCIRRLVEAGIAAYRDSSTGRRFVYRDTGGGIIAGFGIDFTPARVRFAEIKEKVTAYRAKLAAENEARRDVARLARAIEDLCDAFPEDAEDLRSRVQGADLTANGILDKAESYRSVYADALERIQARNEENKMAAEGDINVRANTYINSESSSGCKDKGPRGNERTYFLERNAAAPMAVEAPPGAKALGLQNRSPPPSSANIQTQVLGSVSIGLLQSACPEAQSMIGARFDTWSALDRSGEMLRRMIGLSEGGWMDGRRRVGAYAAAAILATVLEKSLRDPEQISKPGGYFRAMVDRAAEGKLNLERSLFGLVEGKYAV
ncbi:plasmid replication protein RepC [Sinorhizobium fredii]|uniref:Replication initiation protein RepC 2 n=1 Tax=Rhizobium fredii TaxID=380 RepID=A0A2L0HDC6_RHIFR|nr:plasmid replication protein RepC [Sinorhizobium fredii]AUX79182.1 replication initiation protein RepC 2 [Sinorhizobium fredii]